MILSVTCKVLAWLVLVGGGLIVAIAFFIAVPMDRSVETDAVTFVAVWLPVTVFLFGLSALLGIKPAGHGKRSLPRDVDR